MQLKYLGTLFTRFVEYSIRNFTSFCCCDCPDLTIGSRSIHSLCSHHVGVGGVRGERGDIEQLARAGDVEGELAAIGGLSELEGVAEDDAISVLRQWWEDTEDEGVGGYGSDVHT